MSIFRVHKTDDYTVMSNTHLKDRNLSLKAKGLMSVFLSLPDDWEYSIEGLEKICKEGKDGIRSAVKELENGNYVKRHRKHDANGKFFGYEYDIYEQPLAGKPSTGKPSTGKPSTGKPSTGNPPQLNTNILNTNILNTNILNTNISSAGAEEVKTQSGDKSKTNLKVSEIVDLYNELCPSLRESRKLNDKRRKAINSILKDYSMDEIKTVMRKANNSPWLTGDNDRGWKADIEFIFRPEKFLKILEGGYDQGDKQGIIRDHNAKYYI